MSMSPVVATVLHWPRVVGDIAMPLCGRSGGAVTWSRIRVTCKRCLEMMGLGKLGPLGSD